MSVWSIFGNSLLIPELNVTVIWVLEMLVSESLIKR